MDDDDSPAAADNAGQLGLALTGISCRIHPSYKIHNTGSTYLIDYYAMRGGQSDAIASAQEQPQEQPKLFMSRYDVRALLNEHALAACEGSYEVLDENSRGQEEEVADANENNRVLYFERYRDLSDDIVDRFVPQDEKVGEGSGNDEGKSAEGKVEEFEIPNAPRNLVLVSLLHPFLFLLSGGVKYGPGM